MHLLIKSGCILIVLVGFARCVSFSDGQTCPDSKDIYPCSCFSDDGITLRCDGNENDASIEGLQKILSVLAGKGKIQLDLFSYNLGNVPSKIFKNLDIIKLSFSGCGIDRFESEEDSPAFHGLENSLKVLRIHNTITKSALEKFTLKLDHLRKLSFFEVSFNFYKSGFYNGEKIAVGNDWFEKGPSSLTTVRFDKNFIESIGDSVFSSLVNLKEVALNKNEITEVHRSMFPNPAAYLVSINLADNKLETLPEDLFSHMPSLQRVNLLGNELETLDQRTWEPVWERLEVLKFGDYLNCDSRINWVFTMRRPSELQAFCHGISKDPKRKEQHLDKLIDEKQH